MQNVEIEWFNVLRGHPSWWAT